MRRIAVDNNVLVQLVRIDKAVNHFLENGYHLDKIRPNMVLNTNALKLSNSRALFNLYKLIVNKKLCLAILPTVLMESFTIPNYEAVAYRKNNLTIFLHSHCYDFVIFSDTEKHFIEELTNRFMNSEQPAFSPNRKPHHASNDARIMAEAMFAGVDILTFDSDFHRIARISEIAHEMIPELEGYVIPNFNPNVEPIRPNNYVSSKITELEF